MLKKFLKYYGPYKKLFVYDMLASLMVSLTAMLYPILTRNMLNDYIPQKKYSLIVIFGICLLIIYIIRAFLKYFVQFYGHLMGVGIQADMRKDLFSKIQKMPFTFFDENETGKIMSTITNDLFEIAELAHHGPENVLMSTLMIGLSFIYLASINLNLAIIIFISLPLMIYIAIKLRGYMRKASRLSKKAISQVNTSIQSSISGIRVTKAFGNGDIEMKKFDEANKMFIEARKMHFRGFSIFFASTGFITDFFNVLCLIAGGIFLYNGKITFGDYSTFIVSVNLFINPINTLVNFVEQLEEGIAGFEKFEHIMEQPIESEKANVLNIERLNGDIEFKNVNFAYANEKGKVVLNDINLKVKKGSTVALVGESGGGKTTICHLIPRFYNVDSGSITINDIDVTDISLSSLRNSIGIVQQDVFLFAGTFYENILYGRPDASKEEVYEAAKKANIYDYIESLPNGFDTQIGERGVRLSGGQKQRLSIARVFLKNPPILLLDEATSALDNTTEIMIQEALDSLKKGRTTIVVAHRLSTIKNANKIFVIEEGVIKEKGSHLQLMKKKDGIYKRLYETQFN